MKELEKNLRRVYRKIAETHETKVEELTDLIDDLQDMLVNAKKGRTTDVTAYAYQLARICKYEEEERQLNEMRETLEAIKDDEEA